MGMSADKISRQDFGARCLAGSALTFLASRPAMPTSTGPAAKSKVSKPRMVSTMTGLVRCDSLGLTLMHEHIFGGKGPVQRITNIPIATHCGPIHEEFDVPVKTGANPRRLFLSHVDMGLPAGYTRKQLVEMLSSIAREGGNLEFDTFGLPSYTPWNDLVFILRSLCDAGFEHQLFISIDCNWTWIDGKKVFESADRPHHDPDASRRTYAYMITDAVPALLKAGFIAKDIHTFLVENPRRFFCGS